MYKGMYINAATQKSRCTHCIHGLGTGRLSLVNTCKVRTSNRPRPHLAAFYSIHFILGSLRSVSMAATFNNPQINIKWQ